MEYLGHVVSATGRQTDTEKVSAIKGMFAPSTQGQFLGAASCYRSLIPKFSSLIITLTKLLRKQIKMGRPTEKSF